MSETPRKSQTKYWMLFAVLLLLAAALILPPLINMNRYQRRIANAISNGLGRPVHLSAVTLRLLPRPGLELSDFIVEEDPAFGMEPTLRAPSVDASIRLSSLWRGRLEIGRISFDQPSLNLVRNSEGRWNIGTVLLQASRIPNAPTAQKRASSAPRFPYIEASNARVNFKIGNEKKPFSFLNADFSMWLANPDEWRLRVEAQPVRTDLDLGLADTGLVRIEGSLHRASGLGEMPVDLQAEWSSVPMGQMTRLLLGQDTGWRGNLRINADIKGDVFNPSFKTRLRIADIHRQEFSPLDSVNVDATCQAAYRHTSHSLEDLTCLWPIDAGHLLLTGAIADLDHPQPALNLQVQNVPAAFGLSVLRLLRNGFASTTQVSGTIQGHFNYEKTSSEKLSGEATLNNLTIRSAGMDAPLIVPALHLVAPEPPLITRHKTKLRSPAPVAPSLHFDGVNLSLGGTTPLIATGDFARSGFSLHLDGNASLERLLPIAANFGFLQGTSAALSPQGSVALNLNVHGPWLPQSTTIDRPALPAITEGTLRLQNASYQASFLPEPVTITSALATFSSTHTTWNPVSVVFHKMPATLSVTVPIPCRDSSCIREFSLTTPELNAAGLQSALLGAGEHGELLQQILARLDRNKVQWPPLNGSVHAGTFTLGPLALHDADSSLHIEGRQIQFTNIDGHTLGGIVHATGSMDATTGTPHYSFDAQLLHASASAVSSLWHDTAATGVISLNTRIATSGYSGEELARSAQGTFHWDWTQGTLGEAPAALTHFDHWSASGSMKDAALVLDQSQVMRGATKEDVSGTISFDRKLNLTIGSSNTTEAHVARTNGQHTP